MAKPKRGSSSGPKKSHGPKKNLFHELKPMIHVLHENGLLNKYNSYESWSLACSSKGKKDVTKAEFSKFVTLPWKEKIEYFKALSK